AHAPSAGGARTTTRKTASTRARSARSGWRRRDPVVTTEARKPGTERGLALGRGPGAFGAGPRLPSRTPWGALGGGRPRSAVLGAFFRVSPDDERSPPESSRSSRRRVEHAAAPLVWVAWAGGVGLRP